MPSKMAQSFSGAAGAWRRRIGSALGRAFHVALERAADQVAGAESDGERKRQNDPAKEDAKSEFDNDAPDFKMLEDHGHGDDQDEPFDAKGEEPRVLQLRIHGSDENRTRQEARHERAGNEKKNRADRMGEIRQERGSEAAVA